MPISKERRRTILKELPAAVLRAVGDREDKEYEERQEKNREAWKKHAIEEAKKDLTDPRRYERAQLEWRRSREGQRALENWANKRAPKDGKPDFGGRRRTRRHRKHRSTRRR
jgi:hypothetical protein